MPSSLMWDEGFLCMGQGNSGKMVEDQRYGGIKLRPTLGSEVRKAFLEYFRKNGHTVVHSSSLVPRNDPTLLFTNAGMVQFKDVFLGLEERPYKRATTAQKCMRAGGKHNDLENVGFTARHHTFFEMLGNFSFGDYFKEEAIRFAWEFLTVDLDLPKHRLWFTVFREDDEAAALWQKVAGVPESRIIRMGEKDNFWAMGDTGPCGPCSEIVIDRGEHLRCSASECFIGKCDCDRWLEIWNLVFMQYNRDESGNLTRLPKPSVDTGMGLERICSILQGVPTNFDTDLFTPIVRFVEELCGKKAGREAPVFPFRIIADHARAVTFLISDGVLPSNEGRGYVLRRVLRRASRYGRVLGIDGPFLYKVADVVVDVMKDAYPELETTIDATREVIRGEEERFLTTLDQGIRMAEQTIQRTREEGKDVIKGEDAFLLYDTYGMPLDLTEDIAREHGMKVDRAGFERAMQLQRERARTARKASEITYGTELDRALEGVPASVFKGYEMHRTDSLVQAIYAGAGLVGELEAGSSGVVVLDQTPFYAESGGQVADTGVLEGPSGVARVLNVRKLAGGRIAHEVTVEQGCIRQSDVVRALIDVDRRLDCARNHTATHVLHKALKLVLGDHVRQAGSLVAPNLLRFDFVHFKPVDGAELDRIEQLVNQVIMSALPVYAEEMTLEEARRTGAEALFEEKYGEIVRVVKVGDFSAELCGGTHVRNTGEIGLFKIMKESSVGAGIRRIEAVTGRGFIGEFQKLSDMLRRVAQIAGVEPEGVAQRVQQLVARVEQLQTELNGLKLGMVRERAKQIARQAEVWKGVKVAAGEVSAEDNDQLLSAADVVRDMIGSGVVVLGSKLKDRVALVVMVTQDLVARGLHAGRIAKAAAEVVGGGGGGKAEMAQAGGRIAEKLGEAISRAVEFAMQELGERGE